MSLNENKKISTFIKGVGVANESHKAIHQLHPVNDFHQNIYAILNRLRLISTIMNFELINFSQPEINVHFHIFLSFTRIDTSYRDEINIFGFPVKSENFFFVL